MRERSLKPGSAKAKGRALQNYVRDVIHRLSGLDVHDVRGTPMGVTGEDVWLSTHARTMFPITIECKNHKRMGVYKFYHQARRHQPDFEPVVVIKQDYDNPLVLVDADFFFTMLYERGVKK